nr:MAG TPA: hypothetical protein [Bacteriophage sp.]
MNFLFKIRTFFYFNLIFCDNNAILQRSQKIIFRKLTFLRRSFSSDLLLYI